MSSMSDRRNLNAPWMQTTLDVPRGVSVVPYGDREKYAQSEPEERPRRTKLYIGIAVGILILGGVGAAVGVVLNNKKMADMAAASVNQQAIVAEGTSSSSAAGSMASSTPTPTSTGGSGGLDPNPQAPVMVGGGGAMATQWFSDPAAWDDMMGYNLD
ncbi:hypothetical protein HDU93_006270 [Gonapodya sp. JEL0774]|nr:hypothetical protein HDU93_006270 [Gonapodya sp. JEL0774]